MLDIHLNYIIDEKQNRKSVVLPYVEWQSILEDMEELDDIRAYDKAIAGNDEIIPFDQAVEEIREGIIA